MYLNQRFVNMICKIACLYQNKRLRYILGCSINISNFVESQHSFLSRQATVMRDWHLFNKTIHNNWYYNKHALLEWLNQLWFLGFWNNIGDFETVMWSFLIMSSIQENRYSAQLNLITTLIWYFILWQHINITCVQIVWVSVRGFWTILGIL